MKIRSLFCSALPALLALACAAGGARAQNGTPQSPYPITGQTTITQSGYYQLQNNISFSGCSGVIIMVNASNVTIDFNGFYIAGPVGNSAQGVFGIYAVERSNLTIFNGTVAFCQLGIAINGNGQANTNSIDHRLTTLRVTYCYSEGIQLAFAPSSLIADCQISQIGGYTGGGADSDADGISLFGGGITVRNNLITKVTAVGNGLAIGISANPGDFIIGNTIANVATGVQYGVYQNNLTYGCTTPFTGGNDAGRNH